MNLWLIKIGWKPGMSWQLIQLTKFAFAKSSRNMKLAKLNLTSLIIAKL
jgi:hypothetical protein